MRATQAEYTWMRPIVMLYVFIDRHSQLYKRGRVKSTRAGMARVHRDLKSKNLFTVLGKRVELHGVKTDPG
jgi:fatty acid-binding protein DegV